MHLRRPLLLISLALLLALAGLGAAVLGGWRAQGLRAWLSTYKTSRADALTQQPDAARVHYRRALRINLHDAQARLQLARLELGQHRPEHTYLELQTLTEADPDFGFALHMAAVAYLKGRQPAQAEATLRRGLQLQAASQSPSPQPTLELARYFWNWIARATR